MDGPSAGRMEGSAEISIRDGAGSLEKSSSNSDWVKREGCLSSAERRSERFFSGKELMWGRQAEERNKITPTDRILRIIRMPPKRAEERGNLKNVVRLMT
jgi:hypothetical protein